MSIGAIVVILAVSIAGFVYCACSNRCRQHKALRLGGMICAAAIALAAVAYMASAALLLGAIT